MCLGGEPKFQPSGWVPNQRILDVVIAYCQKVHGLKLAGGYWGGVGNYWVDIQAGKSAGLLLGVNGADGCVSFLSYSHCFDRMSAILAGCLSRAESSGGEVENNCERYILTPWFDDTGCTEKICLSGSWQ